MRRGAGVISLPDAAPEALKTMVRRGGSLRCFSHTCADARESAARNLAGMRTISLTPPSPPRIFFV